MPLIFTLNFPINLFPPLLVIELDVIVILGYFAALKYSGCFRWLSLLAIPVLIDFTATDADILDEARLVGSKLIAALMPESDPSTVTPAFLM